MNVSGLHVMNAPGFESSVLFATVSAFTACAVFSLDIFMNKSKAATSLGFRESSSHKTLVMASHQVVLQS